MLNSRGLEAIDRFDSNEQLLLSGGGQQYPPLPVMSLSANDREAEIVRHGIKEPFTPASPTSLLLELLAILNAPFWLWKLGYLFGNVEN